MQFLPLLLIFSAQSGATVEGTVVNATTRAPIAGALVDVQNTADPRAASYSAKTDAFGAFRIEVPHDGDYRANTFRDGFLPEDGRVFHLSSANGGVHLDLTLTSLPGLRGRVLDSEGHAVAGAVLQLNAFTGGGGMRGVTEKDGTYHFDAEILPGMFTLRAVPPPSLEPPTSASGEPMAWAPTFYPGVTERWRAEKVVLVAGRELNGYDIKLRAVPLFHIRGTVVDDDGKPLASAAVKLISPDSLDARSHATFDPPDGQTTTSADGAFDLGGVRPGEWYLIVSTKSLGAVVSGTISDGDWDGVKVVAAAPFAVKGTVERTDLHRHTWVGLIPAWQTRLMGIHNDSGAFEIEDIVPGSYRVVLENALPGLYLDTVQYGGRDVLGQTIDVTSPSLSLRVVYKADGGRVQGTVDPCNGGIVVLLPKQRAVQTSEFIRWSTCNAASHFEIAALRPGAYYAAAFGRMDDLILVAALMARPDLVAAVIASGEEVDVEAGQSSAVSLHSVRFPE